MQANIDEERRYDPKRFYCSSIGLDDAVIVNTVTGERRKLKPFLACIDQHLWHMALRSLRPDEVIHFGYHQGGSA